MILDANNRPQRVAEIMAYLKVCEIFSYLLFIDISALPKKIFLLRMIP